MNQATRRTIGFDRKIELAWLDAIAAQVAAGASPEDAREYVWRLLDGVLAGDSIHNARGKTLTVLSRIWLFVPENAQELRDDAIKFFREAPANGRLAIHWAMMMAAYPFFLDVAANVGKLITMNNEVTLSQVTRRMLDAWGDRSTLPPATRRILRSMVHWGALRDGGVRGHYLPPPVQRKMGGDAAELLLMGLLTGLGRGLHASHLFSHPSLFPFDLRAHSDRLSRSPRLQFHRQGDQSDFVEVSL
ncbi:MAG: hypothetical protein U1E42_05250 [Rhodospirillales bacterium]